jgi:anthranilate phosphoribosyltransferase
MVVHGEDGLDEISISAPTFVCEIRDGQLKMYTITPEQFGFEICDKSALVGGSPAENAEILRAILNGEKGAKRNATVLNCAAALYIAGKANSIEAGVSIIEGVIDSGKAMLKLEEFVEKSKGGV